MSDYIEIIAIVEGPTEEIFIREIIAPYLGEKRIFMTATLIGKLGKKGGDVRFSRVKNDIEKHLKQRTNTFLTLFVDFYGIGNDWPGLQDARRKSIPREKAEKVNNATKAEVNTLFSNHNSNRRFIPYVAIHEFEAMLFSEPQKLANKLGVSQSSIENILSDCGEPEKIDDSVLSAPSKRIETLSPGFRKTTTGIAVAKETGLETIRTHCPVFNQWLTTIESLRLNQPQDHNCQTF